MNDPSRRFTWAAFLVLMCQPLWFFRKALFHPVAHIPYDIEQFHLPLAAYIARSLRQGIFPFWDPYPYGGVPIHADIQAQLFYPPAWIAMLAGNASQGAKLYYWLEWLIPIHMILAGWFAFLLLRELELPVPPALFGATGFELGGYFASQSQHLGAICAAAWLPLLMLAISKLFRRITLRWTAILALAGALTILAGFPAMAVVSFVVAAAWGAGLGVARRAGFAFAIAVAAGLTLSAAISAVQLGPMYQLSRLSIAVLRAQWLGTGGGLHWQSLMSLVIPDYYHIFEALDRNVYKLPLDFTQMYVYCGMLPLLLVAAAVFLRGWPRVLLLCTLISAVWMLGDTTPVYRFIFRHLPASLSGVLYAEFALAAFSLFVAMTAATALARLTRRAPAWILWAAALVTAMDLNYFSSERPMNTSRGSWRGEDNEQELAVFPKGSLAQLRNLLATANPPMRADYADQGYWRGAELVEMPTLAGNNPLMLKRIYDLRRLFCGGFYWQRDVAVDRFHSPLVPMTNTAFVIAILPETRTKLKQSGLQEAADIAGLDLYRVPDPLPRFYLTPRVHKVPKGAEALAYLARPDFAPAREAVVEDESGGEEMETVGELTVESYEANRVVLRAQTTGAAFLATSEPMYPGWTTTVNGREARLYMTNGAFRGLRLDAGSNRIEMRYLPAHWYLWVAISVLGLLIVLAGLLVKPT